MLLPLNWWDASEINQRDAEQVQRRHEFILDAWAYGWTDRKIAEAVRMQVGSVIRVVRTARKQGDARAVRRRTKSNDT